MRLEETLDKLVGRDLSGMRQEECTDEELAQFVATFMAGALADELDHAVAKFMAIRGSSNHEVCRYKMKLVGYLIAHLSVMVHMFRAGHEVKEFPELAIFIERVLNKDWEDECD